MERKLKIAMVASCPFPANHGTPGAIRELSLYLARLGHEVHVITYPERQENIDTENLIIHRVSIPFYENNEIIIGPSKARIIYDALLVPKLIQVILKYDIDVIHTHNYEAAIAGAMAKMVTRRPMMYTGINSMADELPSYESLKPKWLMAKIGRWLDYIVPRAGNVLMVLSDELKSYLVDEMGISEGKVLVVPPGVEPAMFEDANGDRVRRSLDIADDRPVVIYTGALEHFQRVDLLIDAMALVLAKQPEVLLLIAGNVLNNNSKRAILDQAESLGIRDNLIIVDSVELEDLPDFLAAANVAVIPRVSCPGFPIKLLNCMAAGKPTVSYAGSAKALCHRYNGYVAENGNVKSLAEGIDLLLSDPELARTLGDRAKESINGVYDWQSLALGTEQLYEQLVEKGSIDRSRLDGILKKSYIPTLTEVSGSTLPGFLKNGSISYLQYD